MFVCLQFLLCCMATMTFTLSITNELLTRLQLLLLVVMTAVMLKSSFNSHLPVISYLTYVVRNYPLISERRYSVFAHRRRSLVDFAGRKTFFPENCVGKMKQMSEFYVIFARKINKIPEFYTIIARKIFSRLFEEGGGRVPLPRCPPPRLLRIGPTRLR